MTTSGTSVRRLLHIGRVLSTHAAAAVVVRLARRWPGAAGRFELARLSAPARLRRLFEDLGGSFIKFGQMLAMQPDLIPLSYCDELFNLLDRIAPFPYAHVERVFAEELGVTPAQVFERFDAEPLSTASIGQVHVAWLDGQKVAVKVQRPSVDIEFGVDIRLLRQAMRLIRGLHVKPLYWLLEPMGEFAAWTSEELDYRREARYADRLRRNAGDSPVERVPAVFWDLTSRRTLVMEFMPGTTAVSHLRALLPASTAAPEPQRPSFDRDRYARNLIYNFVGSAFRHGVFHADPHPANLLVMPGEAVGYVDFGITGVLSRYSRRHMVALTLATARGDADAMASEFFHLAASDSNSDLDLFRRRLAEVSRTWYEGEGTEKLLKKSFSIVMLDMLILCREAGILPERDVIKYIRSAVSFDSLISRLAPGFNVGRCLEDACRDLVSEQIRQRLLSPETLGGVVAASGRLFETGAARAATALRRLSDGEPTGIVAASGRQRSSARSRRTAVRLAGAFVTLTALVQLGGEPAAPLGVNVTSAGGTVTGLALLALLGSMWRLTRGD